MYASVIIGAALLLDRFRQAVISGSIFSPGATAKFCHPRLLRRAASPIGLILHDFSLDERNKGKRDLSKNWWMGYGRSYRDADRRQIAGRPFPRWSSNVAKGSIPTRACDSSRYVLSNQSKLQPNLSLIE
jgi:hypothetical protein